MLDPPRKNKSFAWRRYDVCILWEWTVWDTKRFTLGAAARKSEFLWCLGCFNTFNLEVGAQYSFVTEHA